MNRLRVVMQSGILAAAVVAVGGCGNNAGTGVKKHGGDLTFGFGSDDGGGDPMSSIDPGAADLAINNDCPDSARLVYVVDENNKLSSFKPDMLKFVDLGTLDCPAMMGATPFSMAVDRNATAWVLYNSGEIFQVDTTTVTCKATKFVAGQLGGFMNFGMGFVSNDAGSMAETLYVSDDGGFGGGGFQLGRIDTKSLKVTVVAPLNGSPELTGTGDAKLWGFFPDAVMPRVSQIDKKTAQEMNTYKLPQISGQGAAWAFAFWGGDFWIFLKRINDPSTQVHHLRANGQLSTPIKDSGRTIVGAGVSTCAPLVIQ